MVPSYIRPALPEELLDVVILDEGDRLSPTDAVNAGFYVRPYYQEMGPEEFAGMPNLQVVQTLTAGVDSVKPHVPPHALLCNAAGVHDAATAELTVGLMIASQREFGVYWDRQRAQHWQHDFNPGLADARVLIVGAGHIGKAIMRRLLPFEVHIDRVARTARVDELGPVHDLSSLDALLPLADIVSIIVPLSESTEHFVNANFLAKMKDGALLVNTSRGRVVDQQALLVELQSGRLRAALDVQDPEPLPAGHPLWTAPNTLITPHIGGDTAAFIPRAQRLVLSQVARWRNGEPLANVIVRD